ncbi:MerC domain-containing protein [Fibrella sp. HMF5335]|uniref:MerC domain-containing protein n=1 Tax=Fibrella rubiginis TaxID=2817060 RepID=A0A939K0N3_9BACT|nr:MerC domain-containing protein [Fibrella rubiginis]MBO0936277.1 MerC domain-containing protein [Fibrella rubiginis]
MKTDFIDKKADYIGITGSVLCIIHCMAAPVMVMTSGFLRNDDTLRTGFLGLDCVFIAINILAVYFATRHHTSTTIRAALWGFLSAFALALLLENTSHVFEYVAYVASAGLVITHLINLRLHRLQHSNGV